MKFAFPWVPVSFLFVSTWHFHPAAAVTSKMQMLCHYALGQQSGRCSVQLSFFIKLLLSFRNEDIKKNPAVPNLLGQIGPMSWAAFFMMIELYCCTHTHTHELLYREIPGLICDAFLSNCSSAVSQWLWTTFWIHMIRVSPGTMGTSAWDRSVSPSSPLAPSMTEGRWRQRRQPTLQGKEQEVVLWSWFIEQWVDM